MSESKVDEAKPSEMKPRKVVGRSIAIALGVICIVLVAGLVGAMVYYTDYVSNHSHTNSDYDNLNSEYGNLTSDYYAMRAPKLKEVDFGTTDQETAPHSLIVTGYVVNVHENTAFNCRLHVIGYQSGGVIAIDTFIPLGTIDGESSTQVQSIVHYTGSPITNSTLTLDWNATQ